MPDLHGSTIKIRQGDPQESGELDRVSISSARTVIVLGTSGKPVASDQTVLRIVLSAMALESPLSGLLICEVRIPDNIPVIADISQDAAQVQYLYNHTTLQLSGMYLYQQSYISLPVYTIHACHYNPIIPIALCLSQYCLQSIVSREAVLRVMCLSVLSPGIGEVYVDAMSYADGDEFYLQGYPQLAGYPFENVGRAFPLAVVFGVHKPSSNQNVSSMLYIMFTLWFDGPCTLTTHRSFI